MNDPNLITVRRIIIDGITSLSMISQVSYDDIAPRLNQLSDQVSNLHLVDNDSSGSPADLDGEELSSSISKQRINLQKSWQNFMDSFTAIHCHDDIAAPLLTPNRNIYPCEDIHSCLLAATQAVPYHREEVYRQALKSVSTQVRAYYDTDDATTKTSLDEVDQLNQQNISVNLPETLQGQAVLEKLIQTRVCSLLAQPTAGTAEAKPAPAPTPAP